MMTQFVF